MTPPFFLLFGSSHLHVCDHFCTATMLAVCSGISVWYDKGGRTIVALSLLGQPCEEGLAV